MRFVSKNSNYSITLIPGLPASPLTGALAKPTVSVRFVNGVADVKDPELVRLMLASNGFNSDFISVEEEQIDPFKSSRKEIEPEHIIQEMKYGTVEKTMSSKKEPTFSPEIQAAINALAMQKVQELLPGAVESVLKKISENKTETKPEATSEVAADCSDGDVCAPNEDKAPAKKAANGKAGK